MSDCRATPHMRMGADDDVGSHGGLGEYHRPLRELHVRSDISHGVFERWSCIEASAETTLEFAAPQSEPDAAVEVRSCGDRAKPVQPQPAQQLEIGRIVEESCQGHGGAAADGRDRHLRDLTAMPPRADNGMWLVHASPFAAAPICDRFSVWRRTSICCHTDHAAFPITARFGSRRALCMEKIHLSLAEVGDLEEEFVLRALRSGWVTPLGPDVDAFEAEVADRVGVGYALALSSGTAALHLALLEVGARPGTTVLVPSMTFAATANAVAYTGADPVFVDAAAADGNVDPSLMLEAADQLLAEGREVVAALPVDLFGRCVDYSQLEPGLRARGIALVEDAAEALGASRAGRAAGSFGRAAAFSFNGNKIMTTSGGGMLVSNDAELIARARQLSTQSREPVAWYEHKEIGYNYRLSNILAALGRAQLRRLDDMIKRRRLIRDLYQDAFSDLPGLRIIGRDPEVDDSHDNCWLTSVVLDDSLIPNGLDALISELHADGIEARHLWKPMHLQPVFAQSRSFVTGASEDLFGHGVNLPSGASMTDGDVARVVTSLRQAVGSTS